MGLVYVGPDFLLGVPARNLTEEEVKVFGKKALVGSGLYRDPDPEEPKSSKSKPVASENKKLGPSEENK